MRGRLVLVLAVALAACDSGGGAGARPPFPIPPWGNFRHDISNSATNTSINNNDGIVSTALSVNFTGASEIVVNESTPTLDNEGNVLIATTKGVALFDADCFVFPDSSPPPSAQCPIWTTSHRTGLETRRTE